MSQLLMALVIKILSGAKNIWKFISKRMISQLSSGLQHLKGLSKKSKNEIFSSFPLNPLKRKKLWKRKKRKKKMIHV